MNWDRRVRQRGFGEGPPALWANAEVVVAGQDITGVVLELQRRTTVTGQVVLTDCDFADRRPHPDDHQSLSCNSRNRTHDDDRRCDLAGDGRGQRAVHHQRRLSWQLPDQRFMGMIRQAAPGWVVHSATVEGEDVLDTPLDVGGRTRSPGWSSR